MSIIFVTGAIGSGKTYASKRLGHTMGLRVVALDTIYFNLASADVHRERKTPSLRDHELAETLDSGTRSSRDGTLESGWYRCTDDSAPPSFLMCHWRSVRKESKRDTDGERVEKSRSVSAGRRCAPREPSENARGSST